MFTESDLKQFSARGISKERAEWQLNQFKNGVRPINLIAPATIGNGIVRIDRKTKYISLAEKAQKLKYLKFVPASGAASRMFKDLFEFRDKLGLNPQAANELPESVNEFMENLSDFAFYSGLNHKCTALGSLENLLKARQFDKIISALLDKNGLAYGELPKGLLLFHKTFDKRLTTPFEEHLTEGAVYARSHDNSVHIHFTVSPEHQQAFNTLKNQVLPYYEKKYGVSYVISFSVQKPSTDTMAVTPENELFYESDGSILFRPGGHGALIENLNELDADLIFIKNIDNVVPESKISVTADYKKVLAGLLLEVRVQVFSVLEKLRADKHNKETQAEAMKLIRDVFNIRQNLAHEMLESDRLGDILIERIDRPIRVCGVVPNQGEPGGGPFIVRSENGSDSLQIVESSQVDSKDPHQLQILQSATHFNPVDLVCSVTGPGGKKYDLTQFVDDSTCFISQKSKSGRALKALELPGLWNGAMAGWNTVFVEVPVETFNPVKTVNDLLRPAHQLA